MFNYNIGYLESEQSHKDRDILYDKLMEEDKTVCCLYIYPNFKNNTVVTKVYLAFQGSIIVGKAVCMEEDLFDMSVGINLAYLRAKVKQQESYIDYQESLLDDDYHAEKTLFKIDGIIRKFYEG